MTIILGDGGRWTGIMDGWRWMAVGRAVGATLAVALLTGTTNNGR
jgi:ABC-type phosphate transport system permease subunit